MRSLWLEEALAEETDAPRLEGDERADVCIVGGGFTGLWTAISLKEHDPALDVVLVEADVCGGGASGRNGGFVLSWWAKFGSLKKVCGAEEAVRLARASAEAVDGIGEFCSAHAIDAHYRPELCSRGLGQAGLCRGRRVHPRAHGSAICRPPGRPIPRSKDQRSTCSKGEQGQ